MLFYGFFLQKSPSSAITCNGVPMQREYVEPASGAAALMAAVAPQPGPSHHPLIDSDFVYDLYYMNNRDFDFRALENVLAISAFQEDLQFEDYRDADDLEIYDDDDDSNDEGNWRNDYPDEDPLFFENQDAEYVYGDGM